MDGLRAKVAVVTGAASGIGRALATRFAAEEMRVVLADVEPAPLHEVRDELAATGADVLAVVTDVADSASVDALARATLDHYGHVDLVCNNAGVSGGGGPLWEVSLNDWTWTLGVNLWGVIHGVRTFVPLLVAQGSGHVVNTASVAGVIASPVLGAYAVSKHAVVALSETLAQDLALAGSNVGVSVLCPGFVATNLADCARNRPPHLDDATEPEVGSREMLRALLAGGLDPALVAGNVVEALRTNRFYIYTHPELQPTIKGRCDAVVAGGGAPGLGSLL